MEKFNPFNDYFYKHKLQITKQEKEQIFILIENTKSFSASEEVLTSYTRNNILDFPMLKNLKNNIDEILAKLDLNLGNSWVQSYKKNNHHIIHTHPNSVYSGIIYIKGCDNGTKFLHPYGGMLESISNRFNHIFDNEFIENLMILFPSFISHYVEKHTSKNERIVISFNTKDK
tara:strand:- start:72 stop:590 length:519 start_codon:yes stop_codon:yes gene_type:complete